MSASLHRVLRAHGNGRDRLLVNEIAPRVHNSGHWTLDGLRSHQFEQHIRAVAGWPLGATEPKLPAVVMINLIGDDILAWGKDRSRTRLPSSTTTASVQPAPAAKWATSIVCSRKSRAPDTRAISVTRDAAFSSAFSTANENPANLTHNYRKSVATLQKIPPL